MIVDCLFLLVCVLWQHLFMSLATIAAAELPGCRWRSEEGELSRLFCRFRGDLLWPLRVSLPAVLFLLAPVPVPRLLLRRWGGSRNSTRRFCL